MFRTSALTLLTCLVALLPARGFANEISAKPAVDVVFVLDTTGSMGGIIAAAKQKVWSIASTLAQAEPAPDIRMGLVAYRDRGDDYVTTVENLTGNLDSMYDKLMGFDANGGGDGPESVNQALNEAVTRMEWRTAPDTYRVIFLVGDAPPHMDYQNDVPYAQTVKQALRSGIIVNAVQCGPDSETEKVWRDVALHGEGQYFQVDQSGGAVAATSPYDDELARLSGELDATRLSYGKGDERAKQESYFSLGAKIAGSAAPSARAARSELIAEKNAAKNWLGEKELVNDVTEGKVDLGTIDQSELPADFQALSQGQRKAKIEELASKRSDIQAKISELSKKRQEHIRENAAKQGTLADSLDNKMFSAMKDQAAKKGISISGGPKY